VGLQCFHNTYFSIALSGGAVPRAFCEKGREPAPRQIPSQVMSPYKRTAPLSLSGQLSTKLTALTKWTTLTGGVPQAFCEKGCDPMPQQIPYQLMSPVNWITSPEWTTLTERTGFIRIICLD